LMNEFDEWCSMRKHVPMLKELKLKLSELYEHTNYVQTTTCPKVKNVQIQRVLNDIAGKIKVQNQKGCQYIAALNNFISSKN
jgi:glutamyl-tRNA reductase